MENIDKGYFTEENSTEVVNARMSPDTDPRLAQVMEVIVRKLHEAVKEIEPSQDEWMQAIQFLTRTGHKSDDWRQEYILLSDILGVSMLVDAINSVGATPSDLVAILEALREAGALNAELIVI